MLFLHSKEIFYVAPQPFSVPFSFSANGFVRFQPKLEYVGPSLTTVQNETKTESYLNE